MWAALQAAGISAIWLMLQYRELWSVTGACFSAVVVLATSYVLWMDYQLNSFLRDLASSQTGAMIQEMRQRSDQEAHQGASELEGRSEAQFGSPGTILVPWVLSFPQFKSYFEFLQTRSKTVPM